MEKETQTLTTDLLDKKLLLTTTILTKESDIKVFDVFDFDRLKSAEVFELYKKQIAEQNEKSVSFEISAEKLLNEKGEVDLNLLPSDAYSLLKESDALDIFYTDINRAGSVSGVIVAPIYTLLTQLDDNVNFSTNTSGMAICALNGNDLVVATLYNDIVYGNAGNDTIFGADGDDILFGDGNYGKNNLEAVNGAGTDMLYGGSGNDLIYGGGARDYLYGDEGDDMIYGQQGDDMLNGGLGNNILYGGTGNDTIYVEGCDAITGPAYAVFTNYLYGEAGDDDLFGCYGTNFFFGGEGDDYIMNFYSGTDTYDGGNGNDIYNASANANSVNIFVFDGNSTGTDHVFGFKDGIDTIKLNGGISFADLTISASGTTSTLIEYGNEHMYIHDVLPTLLSASDFI